VTFRRSNSFALTHSLFHSTGNTADGCANATTAEHVTTRDDPFAVYTNLLNDGVTDTPSHAAPSEEYPGIEVCWKNQNNQTMLDTCDDSKLPGIDPGLDPVDNYMNYNGGACREKYGEFTPGQVERMLAQYAAYRQVVTLPCQSQRRQCRRNTDCCIGLTCIRGSHVVGKCTKCHQVQEKCTRRSDCCSGLYCDEKAHKCRVMNGPF
jgi:hypothetical protein